MDAPNSKQHFAIGLVAWFLLEQTGWFHLPLWGVLVGSLLPDCDIRYSWAGKVIPAWLFCKHRGVTHCAQALVVVFSIFDLAFGYWSGLSVVVGYFLHLLMDSTTPMGIKWVYRRRKAH